MSVFICSVQFSSVAQLCPTLRPHEPQHARPPCPSPTPRVYPNPCPSSQWCHPTIYPLSPPSPALNLSQHQGRFQWVGPWTVVTIFVLLRLPSAELFSSPHTGTQLDINYWFPPASSWQPQLLLPLCSTNLIWSPCEWNHTASVIF